jgi:hypothetical protein
LFKLDVYDVRAILRRCDRRLYTSLREFRKGSCEKHPRIHKETAEMHDRTRKPENTSRIAI